MSSYMDLRNQAEALMRQAEELRKQEIAGVIAEIRQKMAEFGITIEDLGGRKASGGKKSPGAKVIRYRGPNGEVWSGGPGRKPDWVKTILASGGDIEAYRLTEAAA